MGPRPMPASALPRTFENIDTDFEDSQACTEYAEDIMQHFRNMELPYMVPTNYLAAAQPELTSAMRKILLDVRARRQACVCACVLCVCVCVRVRVPWMCLFCFARDVSLTIRAFARRLAQWLVEVHLKFKLLAETLYLTVNIIDRFLYKNPNVPRNKLQLVGITSMLIAAKCEEIYPPEVRDFIYICDRAYTRPDILDMEALILEKLNFAFLAPYSLHFLRRFSKAANADLKAHTTAKYMLELALIDYDAVSFYPSAIAAAALNLALKLSGVMTWSSTMEYYTRYTEAQLMPVMKHINDLHAKSGDESLKAVHKKYSKSEFLRVAKQPAVTL